MNTSGTIVMVYFPSSSTYHTPTRLGTQIYLELKMKKSTHSLHKECFNNSQNITTSSLWSSWFAMTVRNQRSGPRWVQGGSPRKPFIPGALVSFICKWEGKKITWSGGKRKRKWRIPEWEEELWNDSTAALPPSHPKKHPVIQQERGRPAQCNLHATLRRERLVLALPLSKLLLHIHGPTLSESLRQSSAQNLLHS